MGSITFAEAMLIVVGVLVIAIFIYWRSREARKDQAAVDKSVSSKRGFIGRVRSMVIRSRPSDRPKE
jgi:hypothetical protein